MCHHIGLPSRGLSKNNQTDRCQTRGLPGPRVTRPLSGHSQAPRGPSSRETPPYADPQRGERGPRGQGPTGGGRGAPEHDSSRRGPFTCHYPFLRWLRRRRRPESTALFGEERRRRPFGSEVRADAGSLAPTQSRRTGRKPEVEPPRAHARTPQMLLFRLAPGIRTPLPLAAPSQPRRPSHTLAGGGGGREGALVRSPGTLPSSEIPHARHPRCGIHTSPRTLGK